MNTANCAGMLVLALLQEPVCDLAVNVTILNNYLASM